MKWRLSLLVILFSGSSYASSTQMSLKGGSWSFTTENVRSTSQSSSGIGAYAAELGYRLHPQWLVAVGLNLIMSDIYQGSSGYGFDLGGKYYPLTSSGTTELETNSLSLSVQEVWRPYLGFFMRQRIFGLAISTSYMGPGISVGTDYSLSHQWFVNAELRYDYLYGQGNALAKQMNILFGLGYEF